MSDLKTSSIQLSKAALVLAAALLTSMVVFNNVTDYGSNFDFVRHVLSMDTTFPNNSGLWRRIEAPIAHHVAYVTIILVQCSIAALTWFGGLRMWRARGDATRFNRSTAYAVQGLTVGVVLYVGGFLGIGGEWFLMWQSKIWNAQDAALRFALVFAAILIIVLRQESNER